MVRMVLYTPVAGLAPVPGKPTLTELQKHIGGWIEALDLPSGITAYCDEEGLLKGLPPSLIVRHRDGRYVSLVGPVVFVVPRCASEEDAVERVSSRAIHAQLRRPQPATPADRTESDPQQSTPR